MDKESRKKLMEEALSNENEKGWQALGEELGEYIQRKLAEGRKPRNLEELTRETLGPVLKEGAFQTKKTKDP